MNTKEFRIGNKLKLLENISDRIKLKVGGITDNVGMVTTIYETKIIIDNHYPSQWYEPIPLTEEWLLKFGFEVNTYGYVIGKDNFNIHIWMHDDGLLRDIELSSTMISGAYPKIENFKYVHQIQNLYYTLFGEELTIKEDII